MSRFRQAAVNVGVLVCALGISAGFAEFVLRFFVQLPLARSLPEIRYDPHSDRRFTLRANQSGYSYGVPASIGSDRLRSNGSASDDNASRGPIVLALGDSFTFGLGVADNQTWPARLEAILQESVDTEPRVLNAGTISYGVYQELNQLEQELLETKPAVVVHALYWNDYMNARPRSAAEGYGLTPDGYFEWDELGNSSALGTIVAWSNRSALLYVLKAAIKGAIGDDANSTSAYGRQYELLLTGGLAPHDWQTIRDFYVALDALAEREQFAVLAVIMPVIDIVDNAQPHDHPYPVAAREMLTDLRIPFVDGFALRDQATLTESEFLPQGADAHLAPNGYEVLADAIAQALLTEPTTRERLLSHSTSSGNDPSPTTITSAR